MDIFTDNEMATYYEETVNKDQMDVKEVLFPIIYKDALVVHFHSNEDTFAINEVQQVSQKEYKVILYIRTDCYYCTKVLHYLKTINETISVKDINTDPEAYRELIISGGRKRIQVPCLFINGQPHYESDWIIQWFKDNQGLY